MELDQAASDGNCEVKLRLPGFTEKVLKLSLSESETRKETLDKAPAGRFGNKNRLGLGIGTGVGKTISTPTKGNDEQPRIVD